MANPEQGEFEIEIGGKVRTLVFELKQMRELEKALDGRSVFKLMMDGNFGTWALTEALTIGLRTHAPKVTIEHVDKWLKAELAKDQKRVLDYIHILRGAFNQALGGNPDTKEPSLDDDDLGEDTVDRPLAPAV